MRHFLLAPKLFGLMLGEESNSVENEKTSLPIPTPSLRLIPGAVNLSGASIKESPKTKPAQIPSNKSTIPFTFISEYD